MPWFSSSGSVHPPLPLFIHPSPFDVTALNDLQATSRGCLHSKCLVSLTLTHRHPLPVSSHSVNPLAYLFPHTCLPSGIFPHTSLPSRVSSLVRFFPHVSLPLCVSSLAHLFPCASLLSRVSSLMHLFPHVSLPSHVSSLACLFPCMACPSHVLSLSWLS